MTRVALGGQSPALLLSYPVGPEARLADRSAEEAVRQWFRRAPLQTSEPAAVGPLVHPANKLAHPADQEDWELLEELHNCPSPSLGEGKTVRVRFVLGEKLPPEPYPLDEELLDFDED